MVADVTYKMVELAGYRCAWVQRAEHALIHADVEPVGAFVIDLVLPGLRLELGSELACRYPGTSLVFISGYPEYQSAPPAVDGAVFLPKPYSGVELATTLHRLLPPEP